MSALDVSVTLDRPLDPADFPYDVLVVTARNPGHKSITLAGCCVLLPLGLRIYVDPAQLDYPFALEPGRRMLRTL